MALQITDSQKTTVIDPLNTALESAFAGGVSSPSYPSILAPMTKYSTLSASDRQAVKDVFRQVIAAYVNVGGGGGGGGSGTVKGTGTATHLTAWSDGTTIADTGLTWNTANSRLNLGSGGLFFSDSTIQTTAGVSQASLTSQLASYTTGSGAAGQLSFFTGASAVSSDSNLVWDNTNKRLGIGIAAPTQALDVRSSANTFARVTSSSTANSTFAGVIMQDASSRSMGQWYAQLASNINAQGSVFVDYNAGGTGGGANAQFVIRKAPDDTTQSVLTIGPDGHVAIGGNWQNPYAAIPHSLTIKSGNAQLQSGRLIVNSTADDGTNNLQVQGPSYFKHSNLPMTVEGTDTTGNNISIICKNVAGGYGLPGIGFQGSRYLGDILGYPGTASGLIPGINISAYGTDGIGFRVKGNTTAGWIDTNGNWGLGVAGGASIASKLTVISTAAGATSTLQTTNSAGWSGFVFNDYQGAYKFALVYGNPTVSTTPTRSRAYLNTNGSTDFSFFNSDTTELMRIGYAGRVLIGTSTDNGTDKLQVNGSVQSSAFYSRTDSANAVLFRASPLTSTVTGTNRIFDIYTNGDTTNSPAMKVGVITASGWVTTDYTGSIIQSTKNGTGTTPDLYIFAHDTATAQANVSIVLKANTQRVLIATPTDNGTDTLQVNGSANINGTIIQSTNVQNGTIRMLPTAVSGGYNRVFEAYDGPTSSNVSKLFTGLVNTGGWAGNDVGAYLASTRLNTGTTKNLYIGAADGSGTNGSFAAADAQIQITANGGVTITKALTLTAGLAGSPTAPTPTAGDSSTKIATTAFVASATSGLYWRKPAVANVRDEEFENSALPGWTNNWTVLGTVDVNANFSGAGSVRLDCNVRPSCVRIQAGRGGESFSMQKTITGLPSSSNWVIWARVSCIWHDSSVYPEAELGMQLLNVAGGGSLFIYYDKDSNNVSGTGTNSAVGRVIDGAGASSWTSQVAATGPHPSFDWPLIAIQMLNGTAWFWVGTDTGWWRRVGGYASAGTTYDTIRLFAGNGTGSAPNPVVSFDFIRCLETDQFPF